jgi:hypothetical protein
MKIYHIATQRTDSGDLFTEDGRVVVRFLCPGDSFLTTDESKAHRYNGDGDAQTIRDDFNNQFPHARFYLVEAE